MTTTSSTENKTLSLQVTPWGVWYRSHRKVRTKYRQTPYTGAPLPYDSYYAYYTNVSFGLKRPGYYVEPEYDIVNGIASQLLGSGFGGQYGPAVTSATNAAYDRLRSRFYDEAASLGETFGEARTSLQMIADRSGRLAIAASHLATGNFKGYLRAIGMKPKRKHTRLNWSKPKDASALWLEYWMGWAPMVTDIYNACQVISGAGSYRHKISGSCSLPVSQSGLIGQQSSENKHTYTAPGRVRVRMGAQFLVTNSNLDLAARLGLINPVSIAWALTPMSFLVNWFVNVDKFLNSMTDFAGVQIDRPYTVTHAEADVACVRSVNDSLTGGKWVTSVASSHVYRMSRSVGLTMPKLTLIKVNGLSPSRGATAISLLIQKLSKFL